MSQYFVDLKDLDQKVSLEGSFDPGVIDFGGDIRQVGPLAWSATAERVGEEIRVAGSLSTTLEMGCSRCLEPASTEIQKAFDLFFRESDEDLYDEDEVELSEEDTRTAFFNGTQLAIGDVLREQVFLALPMKVLCRVDCKGLCPVCGTNRNQNTCGCSVEVFSPHMEKLLEIKRKLEGERSS
ncbi:MAG TPA: DUF177 domain-containing protein [Terriglobia bacterium]|nr:DUF177 domain-containing protein [Terriglobia bacterium]